MRRTSLWWSLLLMGVAGMASAQTSGRASLGLNVSIGGSPPPTIVIQEDPRVVVVPGSTVYVVQDDRVDYDFFRYGVYWYIYDDDHWYRARSHRGPFRFVEARYVPRAIITVPAKHWRHPHDGHPGEMKGKGVVVTRAKHGKGRGR